MNGIIAAGFSRARTVMMVMVGLLLAGFTAYVTIPKESMPEVDIPIFIVNVTYSGVSAEDAATLLAEPIERQVNALEGLRRMETVASEGFASVTLEFRPGFDQAQALQSVKDAVDDAGPDIPPEADGPFVREIDMALFPILTVALSGPVPERELIRLGRALSDEIETVSGVLQADLTGEREDQLEILIDPLALETYGISPGQLSQAIQANNQLIAAGSFDTGAGRIGVSIPGTVVRLDEIMSIPVLVDGATVLRVQDVAEVRQTFKDPVSFARIDGQPARAIDVRKTVGANVIDTVAAVRDVVVQTRADWPEQVGVVFMNDQSKEMRTLLSDLQNNVIAAVVLVMLVTVLFLGLRASLLVAVAIPGSFLGGILIIWALGFTLNVIVLFALILAVGMLVDGAIVVVEMGERLIAKGHGKAEAYLLAAQRMAWPITSSTATTLAVFFPLLFWPGLAGQRRGRRAGAAARTRCRRHVGRDGAPVDLDHRAARCHVGAVDPDGAGDPLCLFAPEPRGRVFSRDRRRTRAGPDHRERQPLCPGERPTGAPDRGTGPGFRGHRARLFPHHRQRRGACPLQPFQRRDRPDPGRVHRLAHPRALDRGDRPAARRHGRGAGPGHPDRGRGIRAGCVPPGPDRDIGLQPPGAAAGVGQDRTADAGAGPLR